MNLNHKKIIVIRTDRMGDVVLSSPVLTAVKSSWPQCHTTMLLRRYTADLMQGHPDLDQIILDDEPRLSACQLAKRLAAARFDVALLLHPTLRLALACWLAGIPLRVGTAFRAYSFLFNLRIRQHRKNSGRHELDLNMDLAAAIGAHLDSITFRLALAEPEQQAVREQLRRLGLAASQRFVVLHPGSGGSAMDWPPHLFGQLAQALTSQQHIPVVLTGNAAEKPLLDTVSRHCDRPLLRLDGQLTIKELAALLHLASLVVANSTGPLHIARAFETPVIGLFCPILACSPQRWGPYGKPDSVLLPSVPGCARCTKKRCGYHHCMERISVDQVLALALSHLRSPNRSPEPGPLPTAATP